jgi:uncharacterized membrane protein
MVGIGDASAASQACDVSNDGTTIVGWRGGTNTEAFVWTQTSGMTGLGGLPSQAGSAALAVSGDGSVIVGETGSAGGNNAAFIWDAQHGMRDLRHVLINEYGLDLDGWVLLRAADISADGRTIVGSGNLGSWIAHIGTPVAPGDVTGDGVVNIDDLLAVIAAWGPCPAPPATCAADVTVDGAVNIDDLLLVISSWGG